MPNFFNLPAFAEDGAVNVVVETPRGSRAKFAFDPKLETFTLTKSLLVGLTYPHDWGFVPSTTAEDGDPLDVMVIHDAATFPGLVLACRIIGILQILQKNGIVPTVLSTFRLFSSAAITLATSPARALASATSRWAQCSSTSRREVSARHPPRGRTMMASNRE